jgi:hypothetical protein
MDPLVSILQETVAESELLDHAIDEYFTNRHPNREVSMPDGPGPHYHITCPWCGYLVCVWVAWDDDAMPYSYGIDPCINDGALYPLSGLLDDTRQRCPFWPLEARIKNLNNRWDRSRGRQKSQKASTNGR